MGITIKLADLLVDPTRFSPRATPIDDALLQQLEEALAHGETLPPLRVAPIDDDEATWSGCKQHWQQQAKAAHAALERRRPNSNLPLTPKFVLIDGLSRYWALRAAEVTEAEVEQDPRPVTTPAEVLARATQANFRNARRLDDNDLRTVFARLWLGRAVRDTHENWKPGVGAMTLASIAGVLERSEGWCTQMCGYLRVTYRIGLDLGIRKSALLGRLAEAYWRDLVWQGGALRAHLLLDEHGAPTAEVATIPEMSARQLDWLVKRILGAEARPDLPPDTTPGAPGEAGDDGEGDWYQGELPLDWGEPVDRVRGIQAYLDRLSPAQAKELRVAMAPLYIETVAVYKRLTELVGKD